MRQHGLNFETYVPSYITQIANKWSWSSSRLYLEEFGIGINAWRVMTRLASKPGTSANRICAITGMDKALVGRSIQFLEEKKLAVTRPDPSDRRSRSVFLTPAGVEMNAKILKIALQREKKLLGGFTHAEIETLLALLGRLAKNAADIQAAEAYALGNRRRPNGATRSSSARAADRTAADRRDEGQDLSPEE